MRKNSFTYHRNQLQNNQTLCADLKQVYNLKNEYSEEKNQGFTDYTTNIAMKKRSRFSSLFIHFFKGGTVKVNQIKILKF